MLRIILELSRDLFVVAFFIAVVALCAGLAVGII
jgi:hypothetical protein